MPQGQVLADLSTFWIQRRIIEGFCQKKSFLFLSIFSRISLHNFSSDFPIQSLQDQNPSLLLPIPIIVTLTTA